MSDQREDVDIPTDEEIRAALEVCERATPGEWWRHSACGGCAVTAYKPGTSGGKGVDVAITEGHENSINDATFIAASRTGYPRALRAIQELKLWRPIKTAPENQSVLVFIPNWEHYGHGVYRAILVNMGTGRRWHSTAWACGRDLGPDVQPTHWMPLPSPPLESKEKR